MSKFRKAILKPGKYHSPDGVVEVTPDRLRHWERQFKAMSKANQVVPIDWDHADNQADLQPLTMDAYDRKRSASNTIGHLADFRVAPDGSAAEITLDLRTEKAVEAAETNTVYVSPVLFPEWKDGAGNVYQDCITHVDMVNHPVDHSQTPFVPVEPQTIACALRMSLSTRPYRFSGETNMADDLDKDGDPGEDLGGGSSLKDVLAALAKLDIVLPDDTTEANLLDRLHTGLLTAAAKDGLGGDDDEPKEDPPAEDEPAKVIDPDIATMSLASRAALSYAERQHRATLGQRLDLCLLAGQCSPDEAKRRKAELPSIRLSLDAKTGEPLSSDLEKWLESREAVPKGTFWTDAQRLSAAKETVIEPPSHLRGEMTPDEIKSTTEWALGRK